MNFKPVQKLMVHRTLSTGASVPVGVLAQNRQGVFFQYGDDYLSSGHTLSPFTLELSSSLQAAPSEPHGGLHGVFADSLPDGWGRLLQDRVFRQHGILPGQITAMDRLAFIGNQGMGALTFAPLSEFTPMHQDIDLNTLGLEAQIIFDQKTAEDLSGRTSEVLAALVAVGSSGGARPKALVYSTKENLAECHTCAKPDDRAWLIKFTSKNLPLGHEEGLCEAVYLKMAALAHLDPPNWQLIPAPKKSGAQAWLAVERFDVLSAKTSKFMGDTPRSGRLHMHTACGLLDADFRTPSLDYVDLIKASRQLCKSPRIGQLQFQRALFNLFAANQDDHSKNWSFLQNDAGQWQVAPFYDVTFSPHPYNEHSTAFGGYGKAPPIKMIQQLAQHAGFASWQEAQQKIQDIIEVLSHFSCFALELGMKKSTISAIEKTLTQKRKENDILLHR